MSTDKNKTAAGWDEPSEDQIAQWKKEHGTDEIHVLKARDKKDGKIKKAYLRSAGIADLTRAAASDKQKPGTYNQSLFENCVLDMHPDVRKSQSVYQGMIFNMDKIIVASEVEVEKL